MSPISRVLLRLSVVGWCGILPLVGNASPACSAGSGGAGEVCDKTLFYWQAIQGALFQEEETSAVPLNQFNIGDSIGEAEAADNSIGSINHESVWSTGYSTTDSVNSLNERFEAVDPDYYFENTAARDATFNHAISGSVMGDFASQAQQVILASANTPTQTAGQVSILLGNNDVCADSNPQMTDKALFEAQYRAGLDLLAASAATRSATIHVSSIPAIYWLWNAKRGDFLCRVFVWPLVPCQNLLDNPTDDCASSASRLDPDEIYPGDGSNCIRRKNFHARIRDEYNPILQSVLEEYRLSGALENAKYIDVFDVQFDGSHVNSGDCFHPSVAGHALLAEKQWCRAEKGNEDPSCAP